MTVPDRRLDGPIHEWFGLSYSNYQVLHRSLMQSMPEDWQARMVACLEELRAAFAHIDQVNSYIVEPAIEREYAELTDAQRAQLGITSSYRDRDGGQHEAWERVLVPTGDDPVPHYNRGRTYVEPAGDWALPGIDLTGLTPEQAMALGKVTADVIAAAERYRAVAND